MATGEVFSFELQGMKELDRMLKQLPRSMSKTVMRNTLKKAAKPIQVEAKMNAPVGATGNLKDSIVISTKLKKGQRRAAMRLGEVVMYVGSTAPHAHLVEFGIKPHSIVPKKKNVLASQDAVFGKSVEHPGTTANPFFRTAWDATKDQAYKILQTEVWKELDKSVGRLLKKAEKGTLGKGASRALLR